MVAIQNQNYDNEAPDRKNDYEENLIIIFAIFGFTFVVIVTVSLIIKLSRKTLRTQRLTENYVDLRTTQKLRLAISCPILQIRPEVLSPRAAPNPPIQQFHVKITETDLKEVELSFGDHGKDESIEHFDSVESYDTLDDAIKMDKDSDTITENTVYTQGSADSPTSISTSTPITTIFTSWRSTSSIIIPKYPQPSYSLNWKTKVGSF
ncbi:16898_t:CDS:1 [Acaulospora morrowiae]|uniref:16898_t:CDS:1 n=1 Tax=Acaulospora morrowiae TaxID=94023 RepID=A0A9N9B2B3_9GLOM|nr:16898_t:CDS:1 [Acaulospora morrowiae]